MLLGGGGDQRGGQALPIFKPKFSKTQAGNAQGQRKGQGPAPKSLASGSLWKQEGFKVD